MRNTYILLFVFAFLVSCGSKKSAVSKRKTRTTKTKTKTQSQQKHTDKTSGTKTANTTETKTVETLSPVQRYIKTYAKTAVAEMRQYRIPASITLAQGILESGSGRGRLSMSANNHFGIKCHGWKGAKVYHDDDALQECFRKYDNPSLSFNDHSKFLTSRKRYANLFKLKLSDYKGWARGLRAAGYATDKKYPQKLISLIERYELYKYDEAVTGETVVVKDGVKNEAVEPKQKDLGKTIKHTVVKDDTLYSLARRYKTSVDAIKALNGLASNMLKINQVLIISSN